MTRDGNTVAGAGLGRDEAKVLLYDWWPAGEAVAAEEEVAEEACGLGVAVAEAGWMVKGDAGKTVEWWKVEAVVEGWGAAGERPVENTEDVEKEAGAGREAGPKRSKS